MNAFFYKVGTGATKDWENLVEFEKHTHGQTFIDVTWQQAYNWM